MNEKYQSILKGILFAFVFISIGFSLGKEFTRRSIAKKSPADDATSSSICKSSSPSDADKQGKILVYYMHSTFRCPTCKEIERLTRELVNNSFAEELKNGILQFKEVNFQKEEDIARKYKIATGCVVVAKEGNGGSDDYKILEDVWTLYSDPARFNAYVGDAIKEYIQNENSH